jgi:RHS repeat-associated protein
MALAATLLGSIPSPLPTFATGPSSPVRQPAPFDRLSRPATARQAVPSLPPSTFTPRAPVAIARQSSGLMHDAVLPLDPVKGAHFIDNDQRFEVTVPAAAVSAADIANAGGQLGLSLRQIEPASGSSGGGSGHVALGTYLVQVVDAHGRLVGHGLRKPATVTFRYTPHERGLGLANGIVLVNGAPPTGINFNPDPTGAPMSASAAGLGTPTPVAIVRGDDSGTATIPLNSPSTSASYNSNSPVATFGKPDPFNVDLNAGSLTAGVQLDLPRGPGGFTPPLSLGYGSAAVSEQHNIQAAAGWVGEGWNLSLGSISWSEQNYNSAGSPANWQDRWLLNDPYGTSAEIVPPTVTTKTTNDDSSNPMTPPPTTWHTATESHAKVVSYAPPGLTGNPAAVSWGPNRIDSFAQGTDNAIWHRSFDGTTWGQWETLGGGLTSSPAASSWGVGRLDVFARGQDNQLWQKTFTNNAWGAWAAVSPSLAGGLTSAPSAVSWGSGRIDVVAKGSNNAIWHTYYDGTSWHTWDSMGGGLTSAPAIASWGSGRLDIFARGQDNALWHDWWTNGWGTWGSLGGGVTADPSAVSWGPNRIDALIRGNDNGLYHIAWSNGWSSWEAQGGSLTSGPGAASWASGRLDVLARLGDNGVWHKWWDGASWNFFEPIGSPTFPCFRVFLPNGVMEEFGCTPDSMQFYPEPTGANAGVTYVANWLLDLITDPHGNQIHVTYNRDIATANGLAYPRDAVPATIEYDSPTCLNAQTACTGSSWGPLVRVNFASGHAVAHPGGQTCPANGNLRCDDPVDLSGSGGLPNPTIQNTWLLNDAQIQVRASPSATWNTLRDYQFAYDQGPVGTITDPVTGQLTSTAGRLNLTQLTQIGADGSTSLPPRSFAYGVVVQTYVDSAKHASPSTNCGPSFNTLCLLWSQSNQSNSYYLTLASNGLGLSQSFGWQLARGNTHGVNAGGNNLDPFYCDAHPTGYPCNQADDQNWSHAVMTQESGSVNWISQSGQGGTQTTTPVTGTTTYGYQLTNLVTRVCADCTVGDTWGSRNDNDYLDYYNEKFMGFSQVTVVHPDNAKDVHQYNTTEGWGVYDTGQITYCPLAGTCQNAPWWDLMNAAHGREFQVDVYDTNGTTLLTRDTTAYRATCPPAGVAGSPAHPPYGNFDGRLVSELDQSNPVAVCEVQTIQVDHYRLDGAPIANAVHQITTYAYDTPYGRLISQTDTANDGGATGSPTTVVKQSSYIWNDAVSVTAASASGVYLINVPSFTDVEDANGNRWRCTYTSYDGMANASGQTPGLIRADLTQTDRYTSCGTLANNFNDRSGPISTTTGYDAFGNHTTTTDPDANAGIASHRGCTLGASTYSLCLAYDTTFASLLVSETNALNQTTLTTYQPPASGTATGGFGLWPMSTTDPNNQTTASQYDALGRNTTMTLPAEGTGLTTRTTTYTVWCSGTSAQTPCAEIDQTQRLNSATTVTTRSFYDGWGHLVETRAPAPGNQDAVRYFAYDASGRLVIQSIAYFVAAYTGSPGAAAFSLPDSLQPYATSTYDGLGRVLTSKDPLSNQTTIAISVACNAPGTGDAACYEQTLSVDPIGHQQGMMVDAFARQVYVQRFTGNAPANYAVYATTKYRYDWAGNLTSIGHPDGTSSTTFVFDMAGRKTQQTDPDSGVTTYGYDQDGNLTQSVDARGSAGTVFAGYDAIDRMAWRNGTNSPTGAFATLTYDSTANGNQGTGRLTGETFSGGPSYSFTGAYAHVYDARGQETSRTLTVASQPYQLQSTFDDAGNILTQTYPTGEVVTTGHSAQGWVTGLSTSQGSTTLLSNATYSQGANQFGGPAGKITGASLGNSTYQYSASYDALVRATDLKVTNASGSTTFFEQARSFDGAGNVRSANTTLPAGTDNQAFCYDEQNRLSWAGATGTPPCGTLTPGTLTAAQYQQNFGYDNLGRLTSGPLGTYTYGSGGHLHAASAIGSTWTGAYDAAGNLSCRAPSGSTTCAGTQTGAQLGYDNQGALAAWQNSPSNPTSTDGFLYDNLGNRVEQQATQAGTTTTTVYIGNLEKVAISGSSTTTTTYYYANGQRIALAVNGVFSYLASDGLGSAMVALDASGSATASLLYTPYGGTRYSSGTIPTDYGFTGQHADNATGLDYYNARYYDPVAGQFARADSVLPGRGYDILGLSRYAYVEGNPETQVDPSGNIACRSGHGCVQAWSGESPTEINHLSGVLRVNATIDAQEQPWIPPAVLDQMAGNPTHDPIRQYSYESVFETSVVDALGHNHDEFWAYIVATGVGGIDRLGANGEEDRGGRRLGNPGAAEGSTALVRWDPELAARQLLEGPNVTPGGRTITFHAADRIVNGGRGIAPLGRENLGELDRILDTSSELNYDPLRQTIRVGSPRGPYVVVDSETGSRIATYLGTQ